MTEKTIEIILEYENKNTLVKIGDEKIDIGKVDEISQKIIKGSPIEDWFSIGFIYEEWSKLENSLYNLRILAEKLEECEGYIGCGYYPGKAKPYLYTIQLKKEYSILTRDKNFEKL